MLRVIISQCDKIYVRHALYPDVSTLVKDKKNTNNNFILKINPSLEQVSFKWLDLITKNERLSLLPSYFLPLEGIEFEKE